MESATTALVWFDQAKQALMKAKSIDEVKELRDKAEALRLYTKQAGEGLEMQNWCAEIKLRAERRAGELLKERTTDLHPVSRERVLPEGISHIQSHRWQTIAALPADTFEAHIAHTKGHAKELTTVSVYTLARQTEKEAIREANRQAEHGPLPDDVTLWCGDFMERGRDISDASVDLILTDPPYNHDFLPRLHDLGALAARVLRPGGSLLMMYGQMYLRLAMNIMVEHLTEQWPFDYRLHGSAIRVDARRVHNHWKPFLWYVQGTYTGDYQGDVLESELDPDKQHDPWGQSVSVFKLLVKRFSNAGDLILDPCVGGGTSAVAAVMLRRRFIGIDIDPGDINVTQGRLVEVNTIAEDDNLSLDLN